jgi:hypothetical protein
MVQDKRKLRPKKSVKVYRTAIVQEYTVKTQPNGFVHTFHGPVKKQVECFKKYETQQMFSPLPSISSVETSRAKEVGSDLTSHKFG